MKNKKIVLLIAIILIVIAVGTVIFLTKNGEKPNEQPNSIITAEMEEKHEKYFNWSGTKITGLTIEGKEQKTLIVPSKCTEVGKNTFFSENLETLTFAQGGEITSLKGNLFNSCENLKTIDLSGLNKLTQIPRFFSYNTSIETIKLPSSITTIEESAFAGSESKLKSINLKDLNKLTEIPEGCFSLVKSIEKIELPSSITSIKEDAFQSCENLKYINLNDTNITTIGKSAFINCESLQEVVLPATLKTIDEKAFSLCKSITKLEFAEGIEVIGDWAFSNCTSLTSIKLPETLTTLGMQAISGCENLVEVYFPKSLTDIGSSFGYGNPTIYVKKGSKADEDFFSNKVYY